MTKGVNAIITTSDTSVNLEEVAPCSHEEADTRIFVHARHAAIEGYKSLMIEANDMDIVVIAISLMPSLAATGLEKMWVAFGKGEHRRWIPIHEPVSAIGPEKTSGMLFFHAFTGCDVSSFNGKGKTTAWQTWNVCNEASRYLLLNEAKTETILFTTPNHRTPQPRPLVIDICGRNVTTSASIRDLGVHLDSTLSMTAHVSRT